MVRPDVLHGRDRVGCGYGRYFRLGCDGALGATQPHGAWANQLRAYRNTGSVNQGSAQRGAALSLISTIVHHPPPTSPVLCWRECFCARLTARPRWGPVCFRGGWEVCVWLYVGLLLYDTFWVFFSAQVFSSNVMVEVASKQSANPIAVRLPSPKTALDFMVP